MPKGRNSYGNRTTIVLTTGSTFSERGRVVAKTSFNKLYYSTGCTNTHEVNVIEKLKNLYIRSENFPHSTIDRNLYTLMCERDLLSVAYNRLKSRPGQMTPGVSPETLDGMSLEALNEIAVSLKSEKYQFSPGRRIQIPKGSGGTRPLTIAPPRDKLVQECMRMILEAVFEPTFLDCSHGFRPQRGCHTALKAVRSQLQVST